MSSQPSMAGASATPSSDGMPKVDTPTPASGRPFAASASSSRAPRTPRLKAERAPRSGSASMTRIASRRPSRSQTAVAILVPPKSMPSTTGASDVVFGSELEWGESMDVHRFGGC